MRAAVAISSVAVVLLLWVNPASAQSDNTQVEIDEQANIVLDGTLDEWSDVPVTVTEGGPQPSADPASNGSLSWQVVADSTTVYFAATITDQVIVAGEHGENYWNEDSIEFYLNLSGDPSLTEYGPGVVQVRVTPLDIGNTDVNALTLSGNGIEQVEVQGLVFATESGWGTEIAVDVSGITQPSGGDSFGLQVHANGSSAGDRDLKLIWSEADVDDTSFRDPSVFGQAVFVNAEPALAEEAGAAEEPAVEAQDPVPETESVDDPAPAEPTPLDDTTDPDDDIITGEEQQRSLLYAAIASSIAVLVGGVLFERKRKKDEERLGGKDQAEVAAEASATAGVSSDDPSELSEAEADAEFQAMLESILDDDPK